MAATLWASEDEAVWESHLDSIEQNYCVAIIFTAPFARGALSTAYGADPSPLDSPRHQEMNSLVDFPHTTGSA